METYELTYQGRHLKVTGNPDQMIAQHASAGTARIRRGGISVRCLACEEWIELGDCQYRFHPFGFGFGPIIDIRPGSRLNRSCSVQCRQVTGDTKALTIVGGSRESRSAGPTWENDVRWLGPFPSGKPDAAERDLIRWLRREPERAESLTETFTAFFRRQITAADPGTQLVIADREVPMDATGAELLAFYRDLVGLPSVEST